MTLHIISQDPHHSNALESCLSVCLDSDVIVLIESGVHAISEPIAHGNVFALAHDIEKHQAVFSDAQVQTISDDQFVVLTTENSPIVSW